MNLALQSVALERAKMEPVYERVMQRCETMKAIRDSGLKIQGFSNAATESLSHVIQTLSELFGRLSLKDQPCIVGQPASDELMNEIWDALAAVDDTLSRTDTTAKSLSGKKKYQAFLDHCTLRRQYFFMIKKCGVHGCDICKPIRGNHSASELHFLPDPMPSATEKDHYKPFLEVYGEETQEDHRPGLQNKKVPIGSAAKAKGLRISGETVRAVIKCEECNKPRCIYSNKKLSKDHLNSLKILEEEISFICGTLFIPEDHSLYDVCLILDGVTCASEITAHYFSCRLEFTLVCYVCGGSDLKLISEEEKERFQSIHPICLECEKKGHTERKRGEKKGKKRK